MHIQSPDNRHALLHECGLLCKGAQADTTSVCPCGSRATQGGVYRVNYCLASSLGLLTHMVHPFLSKEFLISSSRASILNQGIAAQKEGVFIKELGVTDTVHLKGLFNITVQVILRHQMPSQISHHNLTTSKFPVIQVLFSMAIKTYTHKFLKRYNPHVIHISTADILKAYLVNMVQITKGDCLGKESHT